MQFWFLIPLFLFIAIIKSAWFKGLFGEFKVNCLLDLFLDKQKYILIKNVTLPTDGGTTQIDHIVVSQFGVFVIETKNLKGWIIGSKTQKQWTQKIFKQSYQFQNPLHQNYKHTQTISASLNLPADHIHSVIVFIGGSTFKTKMPENVTYARGCIDYIKSKTIKHFSQAQVTDIVRAIETGKLARGLKTNLQHIKHVQDIVASKSATKSVTEEPQLSQDSLIEQTAAEPVCNRCGSAMVLRKAKAGKNAGNEFWGCSNFPKCRAVVAVG